MKIKLFRAIEKAFFRLLAPENRTKLAFAGILPGMKETKRFINDWRIWNGIQQGTTHIGTLKSGAKDTNLYTAQMSAIFPKELLKNNCNKKIVKLLQ